MSFLARSSWRPWAHEWKLTHFPQKPLSYPNEWMAGRHRDRLIRVGWGGDRGRRLLVMVRFPAGVDPGTLWERLRNDESLKTIPSWSKLEARTHPPSAGRSGKFNASAEASWLAITRPAGLDVTDHMLLWARDFTFRRPGPSQIRDWVERLVEAVARWTPGFENRCEECEITRVEGFVMLEGVPLLMCAGCREHRRLEGEMEQQRYEQEDANYVMGLVLGGGAAVVGSGAWALLAIGTGRIFAAAALGIGMLVAWCWTLGARKVDRFAQIVGATLTLGSIFVGEVIYYAYQVSQVRPDIGFRLDAGLWVMTQAPADVVLSMLFGAVGAWWAVRRLRKPRFVPQIETPEEAVAPRKKAA